MRVVDAGRYLCYFVAELVIRAPQALHIPAWRTPALAVARAQQITRRIERMEHCDLERGRDSRGMSLLEVTIAIAVLAVMVCGVTMVIVSTSRLNTITREEAIAHAAAQDLLAQIRETPFENIVPNYQGMTFAVPGLRNPRVGVDHGEVIIIDDETPDEAAYGRNLGAGGGSPGVDLNGDGDRADILNVPAVNSVFPVHLDADIVNFIDVVAPADFKLIPVVVLIRWDSGEGISRLQIMTVVADRDGP